MQETSELNLDQAGVFRYPTEADWRQLKLIADALDLSFKSSGQEAISPELRRPDDCVNAIKEAEKLLSSRRYRKRKYDFHKGLMHFMLSREVVLGPRGKKYFRDKVKNYKSVRPTQLFSEDYGWYDEDGLLEEEKRELEQIEDQMNSEDIEVVVQSSSTSSSSDTESSSDSDSNSNSDSLRWVELWHDDKMVHLGYIWYITIKPRKIKYEKKSRIIYITTINYYLISVYEGVSYYVSSDLHLMVMSAWHRCSHYIMCSVGASRRCYLGVSDSHLLLSRSGSSWCDTDADMSQTQCDWLYSGSASTSPLHFRAALQ